MDIVISDDASSDATVVEIERVLALYNGPHQVTLRRRATNAGGKSAHLNDVLSLTRGMYIVSFDGDDVAEHHRVRRLLEEFRRNPKISAVYSAYSYLAASGAAKGHRSVPVPPSGIDWRTWFAPVDSYASGATLALRRDVVEQFGPLEPDVHEDVVLPFRASLVGNLAYVDEPLVRVRLWAGSLTADINRFATIDAYRERMLSGIARARRQLACRTADLALARNYRLISQAEQDRLTAIAAASVQTAAQTAELVNTSFLRRLRCLITLMMSGAYRQDRHINALLVFAPRLYLAYKRRALRRRAS